MASGIVVNESKTSLNKDERHVLIVSVISLLISKSNEEIKRMLDPNDKQMQELSQLMTVTAWKALIDTFPTLKDHMSLLTGGEIRKECTRVLGELTRGKNHFPVAERTETFIAKLCFIEELFKKRQIALGKRKEPSQTSGLQKIPRVTAQRSFVGAAKAGAPPVFMLSRQSIEFDIHTGRLGEGAFAYASKCKVHDTNFPDEWYVCKVIKMAEASTPKDNAAALEATSIHISHRGLVNPIGLCRDENQPMIVYRYWNGGNLRNWWWTCRADGTTAPPTHFISISTGEDQKARVQKYIFHIVNALMQTMEYMHENNLLHNDFHAGNVFLHFSTATDDVFAGIGDWGRSTSTLTTKHAVPLRREGESAKREARANWPWMAPECHVTRPPPFSKEQDVYSLGYLIKRTLSMVTFNVQDPKRGFSKHIENWCNRAMSDSPSQRPKAYELVLALASATTYGVDLPRHAGLRPFEE